MKESDLYVPVRNWLRARGWTVHVERFDADVVARQGNQLLAVELKLCLSQDLFRQLCQRSTWADLVIGVTPTASAESVHISMFRHMGFGLLRVDGAKVRQILKPQPQPWGWHKGHRYRMKKLASEAPAMDHELAGLPSCPALRQQRIQRANLT